MTANYNYFYENTYVADVEYDGKKRLILKSTYKERYMEIKQATLQDLDALMTVFERAKLISNQVTALLHAKTMRSLLQWH